eukprot:2687452-Amphidinium_carterae.1
MRSRLLERVIFTGFVLFGFLFNPPPGIRMSGTVCSEGVAAKRCRGNVLRRRPCCPCCPSLLPLKNISGKIVKKCPDDYLT